MSAFEIRRLGAADAESVGALRIEGLRLHPEAFTADPERDAALTQEQWRERLSQAGWFGAFRDGTLEGLAWYRAGSSFKTAHIGEFGAFYVREAARGTGAARALLEAVLEDAAGKIEQMKLAVNADNARAIKLYERLGFRTVGRIPDSIRVNGRSYDELIMLRQVSTSD